jgi:ketosteroid isomerase-like protein
MHKTISILLLLAGYNLSAQSVNELVKAEKDFAAFAKEHTTRDAFLHFSDTSSLIFNNGEALKSIPFWKNIPAGNGLLEWGPQYAEIAASGDFGYTTGPYTSKKRGNDTVFGRGQYATVWHRNADGEWKFLADLGTNRTPEIASYQLTIIDAPKSTGPEAPEASLLQAEASFISLLKTNPTAAYKQYLSSQSLLNRNFQAPAASPGDQATVIKNTSPEINYLVLGSYTAASGDMGYVYGRTDYKGGKDNYMRVWRHEKTGWKLALEVLHH